MVAQNEGHGLRLYVEQKPQNCVLPSPVTTIKAAITVLKLEIWYVMTKNCLCKCA